MQQQRLLKNLLHELASWLALVDAGRVDGLRHVVLQWLIK